MCLIVVKQRQYTVILMVSKTCSTNLVLQGQKYGPQPSTWYIIQGRITFLTRNYIPLIEHFTPFGSLAVITKLLPQSEALLCSVSESNR